MKKIVILSLGLLVLGSSSYAQGTGVVTKTKPVVQALTRRTLGGVPFRAVPIPPPTEILMPAYLQAINADVAAGTQNITWKTAFRILQSPTQNLTTDQVVQTLEKLTSNTLQKAL